VLDLDGGEEDVLVVSPEADTAAEVVERATLALAGIGVVEVVPEDSLEAAWALVRTCRASLAAALAGLEDGAVRAGLPGDVSRSFSRQTGVATALLLQNDAGSPADLKDQVASPAGTTIAGLAVLEELGVRGVFIRAVQAAAGTGEARDAD
jgi:pyrroline-5-carboxylate reductase